MNSLEEEEVEAPLWTRSGLKKLKKEPCKHSVWFWSWPGGGSSFFLRKLP